MAYVQPTVPVIGAVVAVIISFGIGVVGGQGVTETEAIQRGYGQYCPTDGEFHWKNECQGDNQ